jgi:hypothetical protein
MIGVKATNVFAYQTYGAQALARRAALYSFRGYSGEPVESFVLLRFYNIRESTRSDVVDKSSKVEAGSTLHMVVRCFWAWPYHLRGLCGCNRYTQHGFPCVLRVTSRRVPEYAIAYRGNIRELIGR